MSIHQKGTLPVAAAIAVAALLVYGCGLASALDDASAAPPRAVPGGPESAPPEARAAVARFMRSESVFIQNAGQWADADIAYALDGQGANVGMTRDGVRFQLFRQVGGPDPGDPMASLAEVERHEFRIAFGNAAVTGPVGRDAAEQTFNFQIGDRVFPLVIDPMVRFIYLGGGGREWGYGIAAEVTGSVYVTKCTDSPFGQAAASVQTMMVVCGYVVKPGGTDT